MLPIVVDTPIGPERTAAPERAGLPSLWQLLPEDIVARGYALDAAHLYGRLMRVANWQDGRPVVGKAGRALLGDLDLSLPTIRSLHPSSDGSTRVVLTTSDGHDIEAVHMPRAVKNPRVTVCISSQVGCAMGCTFCATGTMGIVRNLTAGEIVGEVLAVMQALGPKNAQQLNLVFMGMGEPLHNFEHVARAVEVLCHPAGLSMSPNRITVSTSGLVPAIKRFAKLKVRPLLAVSVNATTDEARSRIMPVNRAYPLSVLTAALRDLPLRHKEKILLEYVLLRDVNDTLDDAMRLANLAKNVRHNVNVIPLNEHALTAHQAPSDDHVSRFVKALQDTGCLVTVRQNRGRDIRGACGQLVTDAQRAG